MNKIEANMIMIDGIMNKIITKNNQFSIQNSGAVQEAMRHYFGFCYFA